MPPDDFFPKLKKFCEEREILLVADEVLTCMGRTGRWLCMENYDTLPDIVTLGKGFGNGFPGHRDGGSRAVRRRGRQDQRVDQLRRQPDGLCRGAGVDRGN